MARVSRVLLPTGFALLSRRAAEYAKLLLPVLDATLHVVHVVPHTALMIAPGMPPDAMPIPGPAPGELLEEARRKLEAFVQEVLPDLADRTTTCAVIGGITDELVRYARENRIDLIIMGTHAGGMLKRLVFGSVGKGVLEGAPCSVLLVPVRDAPR